MNYSLKEGTLLDNGKYRIISVLGKGGFGITYLAEEIALRRMVAIKEFFPLDYCNRSEISEISVRVDTNTEFVNTLKEQFLNEARHMVGIDHPRIVKIHTSFEENNTAYYVMDHIQGKTLSQVVDDNGRLNTETALAYIKEIGDALTYLHKHYINHLDVKPGNIMLRTDGKPILIDFGLSIHFGPTGDPTRTMPIGISRGYTASEQYGSNVLRIFSPESDIYSLAATLYFLLTGKTPKEAIAITPDNPLEFPNSFPERLKRAVTKGMAHYKTDRYRSVKDFLREIENANQRERETVAVNYGNNNDPTIPANPSRAAGSNTSNAATTVAVSNNGGGNKGKISTNDNNGNTIAAGKTPSKKINYFLTAVLAVIAGAIIFCLAYFVSPDDNQSEQHPQEMAVDNNLPEPVVIEPNEPEPTQLVPSVDDNAVDNNYGGNSIVIPQKMSRHISINEGGYNGSFTITADNGIATLEFRANGDKGVDRYSYNKDIPASKILDQIEGLIYHEAAAEIAYTASEEGHDFTLPSAIKLLKKSYEALSPSRGNSTIAYDLAKSRYEMLKEIYDRDDQERFGELEMVVWGMGEHPVSPKDIRYID